MVGPEAESFLGSFRKTYMIKNMKQEWCLGWGHAGEGFWGLKLTCRRANVPLPLGWRIIPMLHVRKLRHRGEVTCPLGLQVAALGFELRKSGFEDWKVWML